MLKQFHCQFIDYFPIYCTFFTTKVSNSNNAVIVILKHLVVAVGQCATGNPVPVPVPANPAIFFQSGSGSGSG